MRSFQQLVCLTIACLSTISVPPRTTFGQSVLAEAYLDSADSAREASNLGKAARMYALALVESHGQQHPLLTARALLGAAAVHIELNELDQAEENVNAALAICDTLQAPPRQASIMGLNCMAMIAYHRAHYEQAEACYVRLLKDLEPVEHNQVVRGIVINDLALVKIALNEPQEGRQLAIAAADIMHAQFGEHSTQYAQCLDTLAQALHAENRLDDAEKMSRTALQICEAQVGTDTPQYGAALLTLGRIQHRQGQHLESIHSAEQAVEIQQRHRGADHPLVNHARQAHAAFLQALPHTTEVSAPTQEENRMFEEMYSGAGLEPMELTALRNHWCEMSGSQRLAHYLDFHASVAAHAAELPKTETALPADDEGLFQLLYGRHPLSPEELQERRKHWEGLTTEQRRAAAELFHKSIRPTASR